VRTVSTRETAEVTPVRRAAVTGIRHRTGTSGQETVAELIRAGRRRHGLSQARLAERVGTAANRYTVNRDLVGRWERGQVPRAEYRRWLSLVLDIPAERLDRAARARRRTMTTPRSAGAKRGTPRGTPELLPVFRSRVQAEILTLTLLNRSEWFNLSQLARSVRCSVTAIDKEIAPLVRMRLIVTRSDGAMRLFQAAEWSPVLAAMTELMAQTFGVPVIARNELSRVPGVAGVHVVGQWLQRYSGVPGAVPEELDLTLVPRPGQRPDGAALASAVRRIERRLGRTVRLRPAPEAGTPGEHACRIPVQRDRRRPAPAGTGEAPTGWSRAGALVAELLASGALEPVTAAPDGPRCWFEFADRHLRAAERVAAAYPDSGYVLVAEAAWLIARGALEAQGFAPRPEPDPVRTATQVLTAAYGDRFLHVARLRQRVRTLHHPGNHVTAAETGAALVTVRALLATAAAGTPGADPSYGVEPDAGPAATSRTRESR